MYQWDERKPQKREGLTGKRGPLAKKYNREREREKDEKIISGNSFNYNGV